MVSNHENHDALDAYPVEFWNGGKVHKISDSIIHLMRGQVFTIEGKKFFTMGGAESHDKIYRKEGISWWPQELPSNQEEEEGIKNLEAIKNKVDYIITHDIPKSTLSELNPYYEINQINSYLEFIKENVTYKKWFAGHHHINREFMDNIKVLYNNVCQID